MSLFQKLIDSNFEPEKKTEPEISQAQIFLAPEIQAPEKPPDPLAGITIPLEGAIETEDGTVEYFICDRGWMWLVYPVEGGREKVRRSRNVLGALDVMPVEVVEVTW